MVAEVDLVAAVSGLLGAVVGGLGMSWRGGRAWERVESGQARLDEKVTYICDELARRITVLENRVQYDGYYTSPRARRERAPGDD